MEMIRSKCLISMATTPTWSICTLRKWDLTIWMQRATSPRDSIKKLWQTSQTHNLTTCTSNTTTGGGSQQGHGSHRLRSWTIRKPWRIDLRLRTTIMIRAISMRLNGATIRSSHMLQTDSDIQSWERNRLSVLLVLKEPQHILATSTSHSFRLHQCLQILHLTSRLVKPSTRTIELLNGHASGRPVSPPLSDSSLGSIYLRFMLLMAHPHFHGKETISTGGQYRSSSKMVQVGVLKPCVIVMTTIIWTFNTVASVPSLGLSTLPTCVLF